jgi:hypothetical protein
MKDAMQAETTNPPILVSGEGSRSRVFAALLSAVVPGAGHWLVGLRSQGAAFLSAFVVLILLCWPARAQNICWFAGVAALCRRALRGFDLDCSA